MKRKIIDICICMLLIAGIGNVMSIASQARNIDVGVVSIVSPNGCYKTVTLPVQVIVKNYGDNTESFVTEVKIGGATGLQYDQSVSCTLDASQTLTLTFPDVSFTVPPGCRYYVNATTQLAGDTNHANDYKNITIYIDLVGPPKLLVNIGLFHFLFTRDTCSGPKTLQWYHTVGGTNATWGPIIVITTVPGINTWFFFFKFGGWPGTVTARVNDWAGN